jgi:hypothetical protein
VAEAQQLQALVLSQPHSTGGKVVEGDVDWEAIAVSLDTGRTAGAIKQRARSMELITSTAAAAAAAARASGITEETDDDAELTSDDDEVEVKELTPKTPMKTAVPSSLKKPSVSPAEASYRRFLQRNKPRWRSQAQQRRAKRLQRLESAAAAVDTTSAAAAAVPAAAAVYSDDSDTESGNHRWQWSGVSGVAPWVEEENGFVNKTLEDDEVEEAEWVVEAVVDKRLRPCGTPEWEVKWWGWPCTTWEPWEHLEGCAELVARYEAALSSTVL